MSKKRITTFEEAVEYLYQTPRFTTKNSLEDTRKYLHKLGNPDREMRILHVAGTNGKGSVCAYMRSILEEAGYRTAVFTSPHLVDIRERFIICGKMVEKQQFLDAFLQIYDSLSPDAFAGGGGYHPTFFEYLFFMAMLLFARADVDYCILETGLGGRLDATNAVAAKELSVITRIGLDHVEYLGHTIAEIAGEKAGIMQEGSPVIFTAEPEEAARVFEQRAQQLHISAFPVSKKDYEFLKIHNKNIDFSLYTGYYGYIRLSLHTMARYQMENAALAVRAIEVLDKGRTIGAEQIVRGVGRCIWQGRMEEILPQVYVDGAHNEDGIRAFLDTVGQDGMEGRRSLLFSVVQDKDYRHMIQLLAESGLFHRIAIAHMHTDRAASRESLDRWFAQYRGVWAYTFYDSASEAFHTMLEERKPEERIYIAGSLYLVGEIKESIGNLST